MSAITRGSFPGFIEPLAGPNGPQCDTGVALAAAGRCQARCGVVPRLGTDSRDGRAPEATQTLLWSAVFFFASSAASSAYLTVSELFPVDLRGMAIALFYAVGTAVGGSFAPALFAHLIGSGKRSEVFAGYLVGAALMAAAALVAALLAVPAERRMLEEISGDDPALSLAAESIEHEA